MLLSASGAYFLVALIAAAVSYVVAHRKGLNAVGWAWASLLLLVPAAILPFVPSRQRPERSSGVPDETWQALLAYDPDIKAAAGQLAPYGAPGLDELRRAWAAVPDKGALPAMVSAIEARWSGYTAAGLTYVETQDGVAVLRDAAGHYHVGERQTGDLRTARLIASASARRARTSSVAGIVVGAAVLAAAVTGAGPASAQPAATGITLPSCETYDRERPRGGTREQLSDLFGLSIYRWGDAEYGRYRAFLLDCKRTLPGFRQDMTLRDWEAAVESSVATLKAYTGYVNRFGEPMGRQSGSRPRPGEPDYTRAFETLSCDRFTEATVNAWTRGGPPDDSTAAPFSVPLAAWRYEVWRAFENRVLACGKRSGSPVEADESWMRVIISQQEAGNAAAIRQAQQEEAAGAARLAGILSRAAEAETSNSAADIAGKLNAVDALAAGLKLAPAEAAQVAAARAQIGARLRAARLAEAEAWERDRPARQARAQQQEEELAGLQRQNRERDAEAAAERERATRIEAERQAGTRAQAERQAAEAVAQQQRDAAQRAADRAAQERAAAETLARFRREEESALARDPCNRVEVRRQLMEAANAMDHARFGGRKLLDLTRGLTNSGQPDAVRSCVFQAEWSSGQRGLVTITVRKNSFGDDLIEVRP
ncbi:MULTISPECIES: hypothetical protein [Methylobacterium]|uniref:Uncharacterized protein n=1 Tax=Methylobacterium currus TaxID=2051553 RepID=A0A2R4WVZ4_9HYPH|nr:MULTISPECIES: hypothetical protein [Methylobacterium]AWB25703.1 hypothetical protein DA075_33205 [Methylobacterium currus]SFF24933.1 hypothetical protein SAMN04487844_112140 [Methylobacterium sp. yr596]